MYHLKVIDKIIQPGHTCTLRLEPVEGNYPNYIPGQFLSIVYHNGIKEFRRSYSFDSSPYNNEMLSVTIKRIENGEVSRYIYDRLETGDIIKVQEPQGIFTYHPEKDKKRTLFLFAAGVGITPLFSILKSALLAEGNAKVVLAYSNNSMKNTLFYEELLYWQNNYPDRLHIEFIWSDAKNLLKARINRNYIIELVNQHLQYAIADALFYTCGPLFYMDLCRFTLLGMGIESSHIKRETFVLPEDEADEDEKDEAPVDTTSYSVHLLFKGAHYKLEIPYNKSILDVALENGIKLPYSCHSGMCSTCVASCTKGAVRMTYNEVLTDGEVASGRVLVCTAHPLEEGTTIEW